MNGAALGGRQMQRSTAPGQQLHQRGYSEQFAAEPPAGGGGRWIQHSGYQQMDSSRMWRSMQGGVGGEFFFAEPSTPPNGMRSSSQRRNGDDVSPSELSPGLLDLHSFDTELLSEKQVHGLYDGVATFAYAQGRSFDDADPSTYANRLLNKVRMVPENNVLKSFTADKDKGSVAKIKVVVRKRPLNKKEVSRKEEDIITTQANSNSIVVHETKLKAENFNLNYLSSVDYFGKWKGVNWYMAETLGPVTGALLHEFNEVHSALSPTFKEKVIKVDLTEYVEKHEFVFDAVLDDDVSNDVVYSETVEPIVPIIFQRTKATCFAYGQTGSGKTYTMQPLPLRASHDILRLMHHTYRNQGFQLFVSFFEIYGGKLFDLLNDRRKLCMREDGKQQVCIVGLQEFKVSNVETIRDFIEKGNATRSTGTTGANEESSRSHAILQLAIKRSVDGSESKPARVVGKLSFIDLAGSERGADTTDNDKQTRIEGAEINKSLLALKECIRALDNDQVHIPFRGSKLTEVLRDSFIGDSRTVMISCISPNSGSCEHTLNTLRYADRVKSLSKGNNPRKDVSAAVPNLRESTVLPLSSVLSSMPTQLSVLSSIPTPDGGSDMSNEIDEFAWSKQMQRESSLSSLDRGPTMREEASSYADYFKDQRGRSSKTEEPTHSEETYDKGKVAWRKGKTDAYTVSALEDNGRRMDPQTKRKDAVVSDPNGMNADDDLNALLKEEEDLVIAHRKQVEETIDMVREEMKLLVEADQPGNQLDDYISKLNTILSQKAAGILNLQTRLASFQRRLNEHNVLVSSLGP